MNITRTLTLALVPASMMVLSACASAPVTTEELQQPAYTMELARLQGAEEDPQALASLNNAQRNFDMAREHINEGKHDDARADLTRAQADAELALGFAHLDQTRDDADAMLLQVRSMEARLSER